MAMLSYVLILNHDEHAIAAPLNFNGVFILKTVAIFG